MKIKKSYSGLTNLVELDLSSNLLTAVPTPTFSGGKSNLQKNELKSTLGNIQK